MKKLKVGMIGGGGGFFGKVHQRAISVDATREVVAGALHQDPAMCAKFADEWGVVGYPDYKALIKAWQAERVDKETFADWAWRQEMERLADLITLPESQ